jgi:benzodiazapine receptor
MRFKVAMKKISIKDFGVLALIYGAVLLLQIVSALFMVESIPNWYANLVKPSFNPPDYIFGPVWTVLYILMSLSIWIVYLTKGDSKVKSLCYSLFGLQMVVNYLWTILFFLVKSPFLAFIDILFLIFLIILCMRTFKKVSRIASFLLLPYLIWVMFAAILNISIVILNGVSI